MDLNRLKPAPAPNLVDTGDLLEVTVWDLYEPGKAHTFPERVGPNGEITLPWLGRMPVRGNSTTQIESLLTDAYRNGELLLNPRILVRELEMPPVKVYVTGAVNRPGLIQLSRNEATAFAALVSAGGFHKTAGAQILLTRRGGALPIPDPSPPVAISPTPQAGPEPTAAAPSAVLLANHTEVLTVDPGYAPRESSVLQVAATKAAPDPAPPASAPDAPANAPLREAETWYDLTREKDLRALRDLQLADGDALTVRQAVAPVRISGAVQHPGSYPLPAGNALNLWEAVQMADGLSVTGIPISVTLMRPATEDRGAQRLSFTWEPGTDLPRNVPFVQPGDVLHVEPTARGRLQRAVGGLRAK
jgi:protein involved in polysaccharide export with SLBB domain